MQRFPAGGLSQSDGILKTVFLRKSGCDRVLHHDAVWVRHYPDLGEFEAGESCAPIAGGLHGGQTGACLGRKQSDLFFAVILR